MRTAAATKPIGHQQKIVVLNYVANALKPGECALTKKCALTKSGNPPRPAPPIIELMPDGSCDGYFPDRKIAFTIPTSLIMAVRNVLENKKSYTRAVALSPFEEHGDGVCCALLIKDLCLFMSAAELQEFADAFISARIRKHAIFHA